MQRGSPRQQEPPDRLVPAPRNFQEADSHPTFWNRTRASVVEVKEAISSKCGGLTIEGCETKFYTSALLNSSEGFGKPALTVELPDNALVPRQVRFFKVKGLRYYPLQNDGRDK